VFLVEEVGSLEAGQNEVEMCEEAHPRVEWYPAKDEVEGVFNGSEG
jgi:hypothetical protein